MDVRAPSLNFMLLAGHLVREVDALGGITGETLTDDIFEQIFSTFCIGK